MKVLKAFAILALLGLCAATAASARPSSSAVAGAKEANVPLPPIVHRVKPEAPIVMGRSVAARHKTKLHHIKANSIDLAE